MNKKGFTFVELLVTIGIIGIISLIAVTAVMLIGNKIYEKLYNTKIETLVSAAELYVQNNEVVYGYGECNGVPLGTNEACIKVSKLIEQNYAEIDTNNNNGKCNSSIGCITNPVDDTSMNDDWILVKKEGLNTIGIWKGTASGTIEVPKISVLENESVCASSKSVTIDYGTFKNGYTYKYLLGTTEYTVTENPTILIDSNTTIKAQVYKDSALIQESEEKEISLVGNLRTITYQFDPLKVDSITDNKTNDTCCDSGGGCNITLPDFTAKTNYTKEGWNTNASATTKQYSVNQNISIESNITLNAIAKSNAICFPATTEQRKVDLLSDGIVYGNAASGSYNPGDAYLCKVNNNLSYVFFVFSSTETTVDLIYNRNLVAPDRTGPDIYWYNSKSTYYGPIIALAFLKTQTSNWTNISEKTYNYSTSSYYSLTHTARARIPSFTELSNLGVRTNSFISYIQNPMWLYTNIGTCSSTAYWYPPIDDNACHGNSLGYWTYTVYSSTEAWRVYGAKFLSPRIVNVVNTGVRPIITLDKSQISN